MATAVMERHTDFVARALPAAPRTARPARRRAPRLAARPAARRPAPRPAVARRRRTDTPRLRLTLLARRLIALTVMLVVISGVVWTATALRSEASGDAGTVAATVVVGAGETVWDIANAYLPAGESAHGYVARVLRYNDVDAAAVAPGTVLQLPRS